MSSKTMFCLFYLLTAAVCWAGEGKTIDLHNYVFNRYQKGIREIVLPDGKVRCRGITLGKGVENLTIRGGKNTTLICTKLGPLFFLNGCKNVTLKDFSVDYDPLPFTQGTVTKIDRKKNCIYFKLHAGYPRLKAPYIIKHHPLYFSGATREFKFGKNAVGLIKVERISDDEGAVHYNNNKFEIVPGDHIVLNVRMDGVFKVRGMTDTLTYRNITLYSGMAGIFARRVKGLHTVDGMRAIRGGQKPAGASEERLLVLCGDGINYAHGRVGAVIINNELSYLGDDSVNLHGTSFLVHKQEKETNSFLCVVGGTFDFASYKELILPGDRIRLLARNNYAVTGENIFRKMEMTDVKIGNLDLKLLYPTNPPKDYRVVRFYVDGKNLPEPGMRIDVPAINMPNFVIRNNYFHHHRARGMRIMALNGIIENNRIEQLEQQGISVGASYGLWTEAGWVENIIIRNNLVDTVCLGGAAFNQNSYSPGAICTFSHNDFGGGKHYSFPACNKGVVIENNRINNCALAGIHLISSYGAVVRNNVISNFDREDAPLFGKRFGIKYRKGAIGTDYSEKAVVENNKIISGGK
ncbi:MAG: right-handed parallel beta-helix repeat-containing protein [Lentisphaerae bacterium]|nr:right-handed parallel beta-helix repeat-containing protein [Lentisphaerota bacterium]